LKDERNYKLTRKLQQPSIEKNAGI